MLRLWNALPIVLLLALSGSAIEDNPGFQGNKVARVEVRAVDIRTISHAPLLRPLAGVILSSDDPDFGGISALAASDEGFVAVADTGALMRFSLALDRVRIETFPPACVPHLLKRDRDSESLVRDRSSGTLWIGFEWRNAICRIDADGKASVYAPPAMRTWPKENGPEAMLRYADGRFLVFAERKGIGGQGSPLLLFDRDPTDPAARITPMRYRAPKGYAPTDAALLPDGRMLVVNRRFALPFSFSAIVTLVEPFSPKPGLVVSGRPVIRLVKPAIADNFEGIAVSMRHGRTFVWLISDDNFLPYQETYLLKFELLPRAPNEKAASRRP